MSFSVSGLIAAAGARLWLQALAIIIGTFILEDAATVIAGIETQAGVLDWRVAIASLYVGIVLGDVGLYGSGSLASRWPWLMHRIRPDRHRRGRDWFQGRLFRIVFVSRFVPGARLPTYTACGFFHAGLVRFTAAAVSATTIWTSLLFLLSVRVGKLLLDHFGAWRWLGIVCFVAFVILGGRLIAGLIKEPA